MIRFLVICLLAFAPLLHAAEKPQRVVTLGGAITETAFELNAGQRIIAVDSDSSHPAAVRELPDMGKLEAINAQAVIELKPDLVIASDKANATALESIRAQGIPVTVVQIGPTVEAAFKGMEKVSEALGSNAIGKWVIRDNRRALQRLAGKFRSEARKPRALCVIIDLERNLTLSGKDTPAATMLDLAIADNLATNINGYRPATATISTDLQPEVIVTATQDLYDPEEIIQMLSDAGLGNSPAVKNKRIVDMDGNLLLSMGPRIAAAAEQLAEYMRQPEGNIGF